MSSKMKKNPSIRFNGFTDAWEQRKLGEFADISTGKLDANAMVEDGEYDFYTSGMKKYRIDTPAFEGPAITIAGNGATVGYMHLADGEFNAYQRTYVLQNFQANRYFLYSEISKKLPRKIAQEARTGNIPYIVMDMLTELTISLPVLEEEQAKIGAFFKQLDNTIALHQRQLDNYNELRKVMLQKIFNQELRFKDQEGNDYPEWENTTLGKLSSIITKGTTPSSYDIEGTINFVKVESVINERIDVMKVGKISQVINDLELKRSNLEENDLLISIAGTLGKSAIVQKEILPANTNQALAIVRLKPNNNVGYLACFINSASIQDWIKKITTVGAQPNLSLQQVSELKIKIPCSEEQKKVADFLMSIDDRLNQYTQTVKLLEVQKKGLMQQMFL